MGRWIAEEARQAISSGSVRAWLVLTCPQFINYEHWLGCQNLVLVVGRVGRGGVERGGVG